MNAGLKPRDWVDSPCEHVWVLEHGGTAFCRLCLLDRPEVKSAARPLAGRRVSVAQADVPEFSRERPRLSLVALPDVDQSTWERYANPGYRRPKRILPDGRAV